MDKTFASQQELLNVMVTDMASDFFPKQKQGLLMIIIDYVCEIQRNSLTAILHTKTSNDMLFSFSPILQCTGFLFSWDVCGGAVKILQVLDLENYPEQRKYTKFNMATKEASELRAKFFIPQSISSFVQAFSNHTVFTGKSLKYLRHPFLPLVLVL